MSGFLKDFGILFFTAKKKVKKRAEIIRFERETRYINFKDEFKENDRNKKEQMRTEFDKVNDMFSTIAYNMGLKKEADFIKNGIDDIKDKFNKLSRKKK